MTVVVDPYLIAIPHDVVSEDQVRAYANRLLAWDETFRSQPDFVVSSKAMCAIYSLGLDPNQGNLEDLFERFGIRDLSAYDVVVGCERLITNYPQMEDRAAALDIQSLEGSENVIPPQIRDRMPPEVAKSFLDSLVTTSYALDILNDPSTWNLATAPVDADLSITEMIVEGSVQEKSEKVAVSRTWPLIFDPSQFFAVERIVSIYDFNPYRATDLACEKIRQGLASIPKIDQKYYRFGHRFLRSLREPDFQKRQEFERDLERIFEAIVYVLTKLWSYPSDKNHPLRKDIQNRASDQQKRSVIDRSGIRKEDKAARAEVLGGKNCIHLHYWLCYDGTYEFSNITIEHDNATIYE